MRLFIVDRDGESLQPGDVLRFGHVEFPSPAVRSAHLAALERLFARHAAERFYIYAGGFFTVKAWRKSGLAMALGLASIAMARLHDSRFAASFVSARDRAPELFSMLGGAPLRDEAGEVLAPFHCSRHGFPLQLRSFDSLYPDPSLEPALAVVTARLRRMAAFGLEPVHE